MLIDSRSQRANFAAKNSSGIEGDCERLQTGCDLVGWFLGSRGHLLAEPQVPTMAVQ